MGKLVIKHHLITRETAVTLVFLCPFGAITYENGRADITAACKLCKVCVRKAEKRKSSRFRFGIGSFFPFSLYRPISFFTSPKALTAKSISSLV